MSQLTVAEIDYLNKFTVLEQEINGIKVRMLEYFQEHLYPVNGDIFPSTTKKINEVLAKGYWYDNSLMEKGLNAIEVRDRAGERGKRLHKAFEEMDKGNQMAVTLDKFWPRDEWDILCNYKNWADYYNVIPEFTETIVWEKYSDKPNDGTGGCADKISIINDERWLLDHKTGYVSDAGHAQVAAYMRMWNLNNPDKQVKRCGILEHGADTRTFAKNSLNAPGIKLVEVDYEISIKAWDYILGLWAWRNPNYVPTIKRYPQTLELKNTLKGEKNAN